MKKYIHIVIIFICTIFFSTLLIMSSCTEKAIEVKESYFGIPSFTDVSWGSSYDFCLKQGLIEKELVEESREQVYIASVIGKLKIFGIDTKEVYMGFSPYFESNMDDILKMHDIPSFNDKMYFSKIYFCIDMDINSLNSIITTNVKDITLVEENPGKYYKWESDKKIKDIRAYNNLCGDIYNWSKLPREKSINSMALYSHQDGHSVISILGEENILINYIISNISI